MAEAIFRRLVSEHAPMHIPIHVESAGVDALVGESPDSNTQEVCREHQTDVHAHKARQVTADMMEGVDLVLCLAEEHKRLILGAYPRFKGKVFLLVEYRRDKPVKHLSVDDPTGRSKSQYVKCYQRIEEEAARIFSLTTAPVEGALPVNSVPL